MKNIIISLSLLVNIFLFTACKDSNEVVFTGTPMKLQSASPSNSELVQPGNIIVSFTFDQNIWLLDKSKITVNGLTTISVAAIGNQVILNIDAVANGEYQVVLAKESLQTLGGIVSTEDYSLTFSVNSANHKSKEAVNLMNFLEENFGKNIISGVMANDSWNINGAVWVYQQTGKWPAMNGFDYMHLPNSAPGSWIDYSDISVLEEWWNNNGIITCMWHWEVPLYEGSSDYNSNPDKTSFDIVQAITPGTYEYDVVMADMNKVADYLLLLKKANIPVIWRPLHEAAGGWFWWGAKDAESYKTLWRMMFNLFEEKGLNNLIWVWTYEPAGGNDWYPGDAYVDAVGRDNYKVYAESVLVDEYELLKNLYPDKLIALSECGSVADIGTQWNAGAIWSWFMTWYDYDRTSDPTSGEFQKPDHMHADQEWWMQTFSHPNVISREDMPSLK